MTSILVHAPVSSANLTIFALQLGPTQKNGASYTDAPAHPAPWEFLVLEEVLGDERARLHETGVVGELEIENLAGLDLFIQAGDMVKGGRQDRTLGADLIVPARSGRMRLPAFCVEQGRWAPRQQESAKAFSASTEALASKALRVALRKAKSQAAVWEEVATLQSKLGQSVASGDAAVRVAASPTSLQLSMEAAPVRARVEDHLAALAPGVEGIPEASGFVFAINGRLHGAELYASPALFRKFWPKLLRAAATEALAESGGPAEGATPALVDRAAVSRWLGRTRGRRASTRRDQVTARVSLVTRETRGQISFETLDAAQGERCVHQSILSL